MAPAPPKIAPAPSGERTKARNMGNADVSRFCAIRCSAK
jgi:hypothetical protein